MEALHCVPKKDGSEFLAVLTLPNVNQFQIFSHCWILFALLLVYIAITVYHVRYLI